MEAEFSVKLKELGDGQYEITTRASHDIDGGDIHELVIVTHVHAAHYLFTEIDGVLNSFEMRIAIDKALTDSEGDSTVKAVLIASLPAELRDLLIRKGTI